MTIPGPNDPVPQHYVDMIANMLPVYSHIYSLEYMIQANREQAHRVVQQLWSEAFMAGVTFEVARPKPERWLLVTAEERDDLIRTFNEKEPE